MLLARLLAALAVTAFVVSAGDVDDKKLASKKRAEGDELLVKGALAEAAIAYSEAIRLEPMEVKNFLKRFTAYDRAKKTTQALADLDSALRLDGQNIQALASRGKLQQSLGRCTEAASDFNRVLQLKPDHGDAKRLGPKAFECAQVLERATRAMQAKDWETAERELTAAIDLLGSVTHLKKLRAQARFNLGMHFECIADAGEVVKHDRQDVESLLLRGRAYYETGDHEMAARHVAEALQSDPDHQPSRALHKTLSSLRKLHEQTKKHLQAGKHAEALKAANEALGVAPEHQVFNKILWTERCRAEIGLGKIREAKQSCGEAARIDGGYIEPRLVIAKAISDRAEETSDFEDALRSWNDALQVDNNNNEAKEGHQRAQAALEQSKKKNYYKILGVPRNADKAAIKKAYRKLALELHPDRHAELEGDDKKRMESKFADVGEAYEVLTDDELRRKYDLGEPVFENQGQQQHHQRQHPFFQHGFQFHF